MIEIRFAGFGGQGILTTGMICATAGMDLGKNVTWYPSYGSQMRGGTANCSVILSSDNIGSPLVYTPTELIAMNTPSLKKYEDEVVKNGTIFINSSVIEVDVDREDVTVWKVPCDTIANELGNSKVANMVMLGAYAEATKALKIDTLKTMIQHMFTGRKAKLVDLNIKALECGIESVRK